MKCKFCGCTDARACPGGCSWTRDEVCSQCADLAIESFAPYQVRYAFETTYLPRGVKTEPGIEAVDYQRFGQLDFMPVAGMGIDCGDGDLRTVHDVAFNTEERAVFVQFEDCDAKGRSHKFMLAHGWSLA